MAGQSGAGTAAGRTGMTGSDASTSDTSSADRAMPNTAAGWLGMLFSGSLLSSAGLALRRIKK